METSSTSQPGRTVPETAHTSFQGSDSDARAFCQGPEAGWRKGLSFVREEGLGPRSRQQTQRRYKNSAPKEIALLTPFCQVLLCQPPPLPGSLPPATPRGNLSVQDAHPHRNGEGGVRWGGGSPDASGIHSIPGYITSWLWLRSELNMKTENAPANKFQGH